MKTLKTPILRYPGTLLAVALAFALSLFAQPAAAANITAGPLLLGDPVTSETNGLTNGVTVQFTVDATGPVQVNFFKVSPVDGSMGVVGNPIIQNVTANVSTKIFWPAMWLIGTELGRTNGTFAYDVIPGGSGQPLPLLGDAASLFTINSPDIHHLDVTPSFDANHQPTFPYTISYLLAKTSLVTVTLKNSKDAVIRTLVPGLRQAGESISTTTVTWDGLADDGTSAPIGSYTVTVNAVAADTTPPEPASPRSRTLDVLSLAGSATNPQKLFEDNAFVFPNPVRNGQATFQMEAVRDGANLSLKIYTITGTLVLDQKFPSIPSGNIVSYSWNASNASGKKVGRGLYYYVAREEDSQGTLQTVKKMAVLP